MTQGPGGMWCLFSKSISSIFGAALHACAHRDRGDLHDCFVFSLAGTYHVEHVQLEDLCKHVFVLSLLRGCSHKRELEDGVVARCPERSCTGKRESLDALLTMMCDCKILLAADGRTVIRSDARCTSIVGKDVEGCDFTSLLDTLEASRFQSAFDPCKSELLQPTMLPTTLRGVHGSQVVDLFLVDLRPVDQRMHGGDSIVGFFDGRPDDRSSNFTHGRILRQGHPHEKGRGRLI